MSIDVNVQNDLVVVTESSEDIVVNVSNAAGPAGAAGVGVPVGGATGQVLKKFTNTDYDTYWAADASGLTSVGLSMPTAFTVSNTPLTTNGTLAVTGAGTAAQYIRGDGQLATFPSSASGGSSVNYYLNGSVNASVAGYKQLSNTATIGGGTDFTLVGNGLIAQFLTDVGNPNRIEIPGGAWNFEMFFQVSSSGGNQKFYVELLKYNGTTFTSIASSSAVPEEITGGTAIDLYLTSLAVPTTALLITDRLVIRVYIVDNSGGRTVTLHTEDNTLCEIVTTFAGGISALNGLSANTQYLATGTSGTDFAISSLTDTHTFNLPTASATNRGALSSADWTTFNNKVPTTRTLTINGTAYDLSADRSWTVSGSATPAGANTQIQYNNSGVFGASSGLVYNDSTGVITLSKNQNAETSLTVSNTNVNTSTEAKVILTTDANAAFVLSKYSSAFAGYKIFGASDSTIYNGRIGFAAIAGHISILNDWASGKIKFAAGGSSTAQMTINETGIVDIPNQFVVGTSGNTIPSAVLKARFVSNTTGSDVEINGNGYARLFFNDYSRGTDLKYYEMLNFNGDWKISRLNDSNTTRTERLTIFGATGNVFIGTSPSDAGYKLDVNGTARVSGMITGRTLSNSTGASDYSIDLNGISTTDATTRILINCGTLSSTGAGFGARGLQATVSDYGVGTFINANGNSSIGHVVTTASNSLSIRGFAVRSNGQATGGSIAYTWFNGNNVDFYHSIHNDGTYHNLRLYNSTGSIYYVRDLGTTNITFGANTHYASAQVAVDSTTKGFLPPRMTNAQRAAISSPAVGLMVYCTDTVEGLYVYKSTGWTFVI